MGGVWLAARLAVADVYAHRATEQGLRHAVMLRPGNADYHRWLAISLLAKDPRASAAEFRKAVRLNPWDAASRMRTASLQEAAGRNADAERELLEAQKVDRTFVPRWALANFYFRHNEVEEFWNWERSALAVSFGERAPIFELASATGEVQLSRRLAINTASIWESYLAWGLKRLPAEEIGIAALKLVQAGHTEPGLAGQACERLLDAGAVDSALEVWNAGVKARIFSGGEALRGRVTNGSFSNPPSGLGFDWTVNPPKGGFVVRANSQGGLRIHFNGEQCEQCALLTQHVAVSPGACYRLLTKYSIYEGTPGSGLHWIVSSHVGNIAIEETGIKEMRFCTPPKAGEVQVALSYWRPDGEMRMEGTVVLEDVALEPGVM